MTPWRRAFGVRAFTALAQVARTLPEMRKAVPDALTRVAFTPTVGAPVHRPLIALAVAALFASSTASCRDSRSAAAPLVAPARRGGETGAALLAKVSALDDFAPCLIGVAADVAPVQLVDAEVAGEAARATFACANGALRGTVTFFRVAGVWMISTKELVRAPRRDR